MRKNNNSNIKTTPEIRTFYFEGHKIRVAIVDDQPWFVLADVCKALGIENSENVLSELDDDEKAALDIIDVRSESQQYQAFATINEAGFSQIITDDGKTYTQIHRPNNTKNKE